MMIFERGLEFLIEHKLHDINELHSIICLITKFRNKIIHYDLIFALIFRFYELLRIAPSRFFDTPSPQAQEGKFFILNFEI